MIVEGKKEERKRSALGRLLQRAAEVAIVGAEDINVGGGGGGNSAEAKVEQKKDCNVCGKEKKKLSRARSRRRR